jgi:hypothetical protein
MKVLITAARQVIVNEFSRNTIRHSMTSPGRCSTNWTHGARVSVPPCIGTPVKRLKFKGPVFEISANREGCESDQDCLSAQVKVPQQTADVTRGDRPFFVVNPE